MEYEMCLFCHVDCLSPDDQYCINCGKPVDSNYCTNDDCIMNTGHDDPVTLVKEACFCSECGSKTTYFADGLIEPRRP